MFFETMTESLMQLSLNSVIIREFGLSPNVYERSNQISGLVSSLISIVLLFAKVRTKHNQIIIDFIPLGFSLSTGNWLHAYLRSTSLSRCDFLAWVSSLEARVPSNFVTIYHCMYRASPNYTIFQYFRCKSRIALVEIVIQSHLRKFQVMQVSKFVYINWGSSAQFSYDWMYLVPSGNF